MLTSALIVIIVSIIVGVAGQLSYLFIVDQEKLKLSKGKIRELQQKLKGLKYDDPNFKQLYNELMQENSKIMRESMKPTFITFIPFLIVFFLMSSYFNYVPIQYGVPISLSVNGLTNGTLYSANGCLLINNSSNVTITGNLKSSLYSAKIMKPDCTVLFTSYNKTTYNASISSLIGSKSIEKFNINGGYLTFTPNELIVFSLPFSLPFIGNSINWFWAYIIFSFLSSIILNRILAHYKLIA